MARQKTERTPLAPSVKSENQSHRGQVLFEKSDWLILRALESIKNCITVGKTYICEGEYEGQVETFYLVRIGTAEKGYLEVIKKSRFDIIGKVGGLE